MQEYTLHYQNYLRGSDLTTTTGREPLTTYMQTRSARGSDDGSGTIKPENLAI
jgi:hypothetical protein